MPDTNIIAQGTAQPQAITSYCPSEIVDIFSDFLSRAGLGTKVVFVTGIYARTARQSYSGWYYDTLKDQNSDQELSLMISQSLRDTLDDGSLVTVGGTVFKRPGNRGNIQLGFKVTRVETLQQQAVSEEDMKRAELRTRKTQKGFTNVEGILEGILMRGERPKVALIFAANSITMSDFDAGKHAAEASMDFTEYRVNFSSANDLCDLLTRVDGDGFDVLALIRGGGSGIEHLDDLSVLEKVVSLETPLICAVGHPDEKLFLKLVSDKVSPVPHGLGTWFHELTEKVTKTRQDSIAVITKQVEKQFQERLETQVKQNKDLQEKITSLTKQAEESRKQSAEASKKLTEQHAADNKKLQEQLDAQLKQNKDLQEKITTLTKQAEESRKQSAEASRKLAEQHAADNKKLQDQLAEANTKNGDLAKTIESQTKTHSEEMKALNATLAGFKKDSAEQAEKQNEAFTSLQKNYGDLQQQNGRLNRELTQAREDLAKATSGSGKVNGLTIVLIIVVVILFIILLVK